MAAAADAVVVLLATMLSLSAGIALTQAQQLGLYAGGPIYLSSPCTGRPNDCRRGMLLGLHAISLLLHML